MFTFAAKTFFDFNGREAPPPSIDLANVSERIQKLPEKEVYNIAKRAGETLKTWGETYNKALENRLKSDPRLQEALANLMQQYGMRTQEFWTISRNDQKKFLDEAGNMLKWPGGNFFRWTSGNMDFWLLAINTTITNGIVRPKTAPIGLPVQPPVSAPIHTNSTSVSGWVNRVGPGGFQKWAFAYWSWAINEVGTTN